MNLRAGNRVLDVIVQHRGGAGFASFLENVSNKENDLPEQEVRWMIGHELQSMPGH